MVESLELFLPLEGLIDIAVERERLTKRINELAAHLKKHNKDKHSRRGLLQMVADRRGHLKHLEKKNKRKYNDLIKKLGLKR